MNERERKIREMQEALKKDPELFEFMKWCRTLTSEQRKETLHRLQMRKTK